MKKYLFLFLWFVTIIFTAIWTFENPEKIEKIKSEFKKNKKIETKLIANKGVDILANSFTLKLSQVLENNIKNFVKKKDIKFVLFGKPTRLLLINLENGPSISDILFILGKKNSIERIKNYIRDI